MSSGDSLYNKIDTFIFFDLETTDLIKGKKMPRIIEMSMVAVARKSIKPNEQNKLTLPRIMHKMIIPICPMQSINYAASHVSNLWNDMFDDIKPFDKNTYNLIIEFINRLPGLICFVAHNGNNFDYPVFLSELERLNETLPDKILCVDTYKAFQEIFRDREEECKISSTSESLHQSSKEKKDGTTLSDAWNNELFSCLDHFEKGKIQKIEDTMPASCQNDKVVLDKLLHETEQDRTYLSENSSPSESTLKLMQQINERTPENKIIRNSQIRLDNKPEKRFKSVVKQLDFSNKKPKNFKLSTLYMHMIGCEAENLHCAETDCIAMLRCVCQIGPYFVEWADHNAISLNLIRSSKSIKS